MNNVTFEEMCFFIAPIGPEGSEIRGRSDKVLKYVVTPAAQELGLTALRADNITSPGQINLQVIEYVMKSRGAVVDLTSLNPNVFYELAVRHALKAPVALICDKGTNIPFDISQMRTIFFDHTDLDSVDHCKREIVAHLREALEEGAVDSPIATAVDLGTLQSGSAIERSVAELVTSVEELGHIQRQILTRTSGLARHSTLNPKAAQDLVESLPILHNHVDFCPHDDEDLIAAIEKVDRATRHIVRTSRGPIKYDLNRRIAENPYQSAGSENYLFKDKDERLL